MASSRVSGARVDHLLQAAREPAYWLGPDLKIVWVNRAWEELTGHAATAVVGLACQPHGPTRPGDPAGLGGSLYPPPEAIAGQPASARTMLIHPSGERLWRRLDVVPFHGPKGELIGLLGLLRTLDEPAAGPDSDAQHLRAELLEVRDHLQARYGLDSLVGRGPAHRRLLDQVTAAAASTVPVLVVGEPGTGRRLVARTIHHLSPRRQAPLVPIDSAALPPDVLERQLFGPPASVEEAPAPVLPRLALPDGSTLLLHDILDVPRDLQARLAAALYGPVRLVATTATPPESALQAERLRPDLYYALTTLVIRLAPLRDRLDELPLLAQHFLERANLRAADRHSRSGFAPDAIRALLGYDWPGNLRELNRVVDDARTRGDGLQIEAADLPAAIRGHLGSAYVPPPLPPHVVPLDELLTQVERRLIEHALARSRHNKSKAAELLGISRPRLYRRIRELGLPDEPEGNEDLAPAASAPPQIDPIPNGTRES